MVQTIIDIDEKTNRVLNIVKAKFGLNDKSEAIDLMAEQYAQQILEPKLRPKYQAKLSRIMKGKHLSREDLEKEIA